MLPNQLHSLWAKKLQLSSPGAFVSVKVPGAKTFGAVSCKTVRTEGSTHAVGCIEGALLFTPIRYSQVVALFRELAGLLLFF